MKTRYLVIYKQNEETQVEIFKKLKEARQFCKWIIEQQYTTSQFIDIAEIKETYVNNNVLNKRS